MLHYYQSCECSHCLKISIIFFQDKMFQLLHFPLLQSSLMVWTSLECRLPRRGKPARCSDTPVAVWSTPKWPHWTTAAPLSGSVLTPPCPWRASCELDLGVALLGLHLFQIHHYSPSVHFVFMSGFDPCCFISFIQFSADSYHSFVPLLSHPCLLLFIVAGTMEQSAEQMQSPCSGCVRRPVTWWETARPARTTTPSPSSKDNILFS